MLGTNPQRNLLNIVSWEAHLLARFWFHVVPDDRRPMLYIAYGVRSTLVKSKVKKEEPVEIKWISKISDIFYDPSHRYMILPTSTLRPFPLKLVRSSRGEI